MRHLLFTIFLIILLHPAAMAQDSDSVRLRWQDENLADSVRFEAGLTLFRMQFRTDLTAARATGSALVEFSENRNNTEWEAIAHRYLGNSYAIQGDYVEALERYQLSQELSSDKRMAATNLSNIGTVYYEMGNYPLAIENLLEGLHLSEELDDKAGISRVTNNLGNVYLRQKNNEKALEYYSYSVQIKEELGDADGMANGFNNIGLVHENLKQYDLAIENLLKSARLGEENGNLMAMSRANGNLGSIYTQMGRYEEALNYLNGTIEVKRDIDDRDGLSHALLYRGQTYLALGQSARAISDCSSSLELSASMKASGLERDACECLSQAYEKQGNFRQALDYQRRSAVLRDSLFSREKTEEITRQEMLYAFEKQQLADSIAFHKEKAEQELSFMADLNRQRNMFSMIVIGGLGLLIIGAVYWRSRQKSRKLENERAVNARLKQVDQLKDQFLANTSHELRTPLNGIIGITESLRDGVAGKMSGKAVENLEMISNAGKRLSYLINDLLDFSKLKNRDLVLSRTPVDLHALTDVVLRFSESLARNKPVKLVNSIPPDLPLADADENRLQQIMYNLVGNAIKFTREGKVEIRAEEQDGMIHVKVSDTGIGIPSENQERIFESFEQGDGSTIREFGGTGLGLSVSRQLVELHGGKISVKSETGKGSDFTFTIPVSTAKHLPVDRQDRYEGAVQKIQADTEESDDLENVSVRDIHILVVDDEPVNRRVLQNHLSVAGYQVTEVGHGEDALKLIEGGQKFDLVLLDVMMPGMSGYEVCSQIRKKYLASELPVVLLTARNRVSDLVTGFNAGANDYLTKPFSKNELLSRIKTHLNLYGIHKATSRFVPSEFIRSVGREEITEVLLGDHVEKEVTVLFSDIREYTRLAEGMTPEENFKFVNSYVGRMGPVIHENRGFVNQYLGDGIMALFPDHPEDALRSAIAMQQNVQEYNRFREEDGRDPISIGIGLHTGSLIMGIIGDVYRNDTAIIADTVNTSSRMEGLSKHFGAQIILSEESLNYINEPEQFGLRYLGKVQVKGKEKPLGIYECFDGEPAESITLKKKTLKNFNKGIQHFIHYEFPKASAAFDHVLSIDPEDEVARYFMSKAAEYTLAGIPKDKGFVTIMHEK